MKNIKLRLAARCEAAGRPNNEDNYQVDENLADDQWGFTTDKEFSLGDKGTLLLVCDGMGGMNAGEVASEIAVKSIQKYFSADKLTDDIITSSSAIKDYIKKSIVFADSQIKQEGKKDEAKRGMGSTIVLAWLINGKVYVGWCGDSRAYCYNSKTGLRQLSHDHSYVQELVDAGKLSPELAFDHPHNNIITRSLGDNNMDAKPDVAEFDLHNEDIILLCSDGLCGVLRDNEIEYFIANNQTSMSECRDALWEGSRQVGWTDNTTVVLAQIISGAAIIKEDRNIENNIVNINSSSKGIKLKYVVLLVFVSLFLGVSLSFGYIYRARVLEFCKKIETIFDKKDSDVDENVLPEESEETPNLVGEEVNGEPQLNKDSSKVEKTQTTDPKKIQENIVKGLNSIKDMTNDVVSDTTITEEKSVSKGKEKEGTGVEEVTSDSLDSRKSIEGDTIQMLNNL